MENSVKKIAKVSLFFLGAFLLTGLLSAKLLAQADWNVTIRVWVFDDTTSDPIEGAQVLFMPIGIAFSTDASGYTEASLTIPNASPDTTVSVTVSAIGYVSQTRTTVCCPIRIDHYIYLVREVRPPAPPPPEPPPEPGPTPTGEICELPPPCEVGQCLTEAIIDPNPNDTICCSPIRANLRAVDHVENVDYLPCGVEVVCTYSCDPSSSCTFDSDCSEVYGGAGGICIDGGCCQEECYDPCHELRFATVNRQIGLSLLHPYLDPLWELTSNTLTGFFNIMRPNPRPQFEDLAGQSQIRYRASGVDIFPAIGNFFYPHLGGIQRAKEEIIRTVTPQEAIGR